MTLRSEAVAILYQCNNYRPYSAFIQLKYGPEFDKPSQILTIYLKTNTLYLNIYQEIIYVRVSFTT